MKQFTYKRNIEENKDATPKYIIDSFNTDMVLRTIGSPDGSRLVILNDIHNRIELIPLQGRNGKPGGIKKETYTAQSEIPLIPEDGARFLQLIDTMSTGG